MSKAVIEDLRLARSRLDEAAARCAERKATIDRLKAEDCGRDPFHDWNDPDLPDREDGRDTSAAPGRRPASS